MKKVLLKTPLALLCAVLISPATNSQDRTKKMSERVRADQQVRSLIVNRERKTPSFIAFDSKRVVDASKLASLMNNYLDVRNGVDELRPKNTTSYVNGLAI